MITVLGIDVAKAKFDTVLLREGGSTTHKIFANTPAGFAQLQAWLQQNKAQRVHACLEVSPRVTEKEGFWECSRKPADTEVIAKVG
jgi:transposase